jgi:hypothetical protein
MQGDSPPRFRRRAGAPPSSDGIGPDGTVRLRCYAALADTHWFSANCPACGRVAPIGVAAAIAAAGSPEATVGALARRLRCRGCGERRILVQIASDPRPLEVREREGRAPETRATLPRR